MHFWQGAPVSLPLRRTSQTGGSVCALYYCCCLVRPSQLKKQCFRSLAMQPRSPPTPHQAGAVRPPGPPHKRAVQLHLARHSPR